MFKKKLSILVLFTFLFTMALPLAASADSSARDLFMDNWNIQVEKQQQADYTQPFSGEIKFNAEFAGALFSDLFGVNEVNADIKYDMDMQKEIAFINLNANVDGDEAQSISLDMYLNDNKVIIPVECLEAMALFDPTMELPDANIEYVYTEIDGFSFDELQAILDQSSQQEAAMDLVQVLFEAVPEQSFSSQGTSALMNLDKDSLTDIVKSFQDEEYVARLADSIVALEPTADREEIISGLTLPEDISVIDLFKNLEINKCETEIGPEKSLMDWDLAYTTEEFVMDCQVKSNGTINEDKTESTMSANVNFESPDDNSSASIILNADFSGNANQYAMTGDMNISGKQLEEDFEISMNFSIDQSYKDQLDLVMPVLTEENSINTTKLEPETEEYDGTPAITLNLNDEDYIWFDNTPFIENDRVMVPIAELGQYLDYQVSWEPPATICINTEGIAMSINPGSKQYAINGEFKEMDTAPLIKDGVSYAPISFIASELGYEVSYDQEYEELFLTPIVSE